MKKVLSSILIGSMLISSMGAISIFADGTETSVSATEKASSEASSTETELGEAIGKLKENIKKLEVKSFWERNKGTILKVTGGALAAAATGAALYLGYNYLWANGTPLVNPAGDQIGNPTEDPAVKSVQSQDPTATAAGTSANPAVDPAANSDQTPTPQVEGIQSKEAPVNTDVCLQEEENICLPVDKDIINTADVSADPSTNPAVNPSASQAETPIGKQADATPENQMSCDIASKEAEAALEDLKSAYLERLKIQLTLRQKSISKADERYISASNKVGKCNPIHLSGKEGMCLIDNKDTEADHSSTIPKTETIFCKENALEDATSKVWGGISSTASKGWKAMWDFDDAAAEYTYVGPVKATALVVGSLLTILGGKRMGLTPTKFMNALRRGGAAPVTLTSAAAGTLKHVLTLPETADLVVEKVPEMAQELLPTVLPLRIEVIPTTVVTEVAHLVEAVERTTSTALEHVVSYYSMLPDHTVTTSITEAASSLPEAWYSMFDPAAVPEVAQQLLPTVLPLTIEVIPTTVVTEEIPELVRLVAGEIPGTISSAIISTQRSGVLAAVTAESGVGRTVTYIIPLVYEVFKGFCRTDGPAAATRMVPELLLSLKQRLPYDAQVSVLQEIINFINSPNYFPLLKS